MFRRSVLASIVAVLILSLFVASAPVEAGIRKVVLGVTLENNGSIATVDQFSAALGRRPAMSTLWSSWGNATKEFPTSKVNALKARNITPFIWWQPAKSRSSCEYANHNEIANGKHDAYIRDWARKAKQFNSRILLRWAAEMNGKFFPWSIHNCGNSLKSFKRAWRHIVTIFRQEGAWKVRFVQTVATSKCPGGCNPYKGIILGKKWVHLVGVSAFNWGAHKKWKTLPEGLKLEMARLKQVTSRPIILAEVATATLRGPTAQPWESKPQWIKTGYAAAYKKYPNIKAMVYLNVDLSSVGHPNWNMAHNHPQNLDKWGNTGLDAYRKVSNQKRFKGHF